MFAGMFANIYSRLSFYTFAAALLLSASLTGATHVAAQASPDKIVYSTGSELYVMDPDGGNQTPISTPGLIAFDPTWSPDGKAILFTCRGSEERNICRVNADGTGLVMLSDTGKDYDAQYSPDGSKIAFTSERDSLPRIYLMNADGTNQVRLDVNDPDFISLNHPTWSPDGKRIAFSAETETDVQIYSVEVANPSAPLRVTFTDAMALDPAWSPDGSMIAFGDFKHIYKVPAGGGQAIQVTSGDPDVVEHASAAWSPDGSRLAFWRQEVHRDENGGREVVRGIYVSNADGSNMVNTQTPNGGHPSWRPALTNTPPDQELSAAERINNLMATIKGFGLPFGITNALTVKLKAAQQNLAAGDTAGACSNLESFINQVNAQSGKKLTAAQAEQVATEAAAIRALLGCQ